MKINNNPTIVKVKSGRNGPVIRNKGINMNKYCISLLFKFRKFIT